MPAVVRVLTRKSCCLCEDAEVRVWQLEQEGLCVLERVDVDANLALATRYGADVPVIFLHDEEVMRHRVDMDALRHLLMFA